MPSRFLESPSTATRHGVPVPWFVNDEDELREIIDVLDDGRPRLISLTTVNHEVTFGVGCRLSKLSFVSCFDLRDGGTFLARPLQPCSGKQSIRFLAQGGREKEVQAEWLLPIEDVMRIVVHLFCHDERPAWANWQRQLD